MAVEREKSNVATALLEEVIRYEANEVNANDVQLGINECFAKIMDHDNEEPTPAAATR